MKEAESNSSEVLDAEARRLDQVATGEETCPMDFVLSLLRAKGIIARVEPSMSSQKFLPPSEEQIELYNIEILTAVRDQNIELLQSMNQSGRSLQCCNRFGESLIHMACRRGFYSVVRFMVEEANVSLYVKDDYGRTPMHDACWAPSPNFSLMELLIKHAPEQLFLADVRGHTPLSYVRKHDWAEWKRFLSERESLLVPKESKDDAKESKDA